MVCYRSCFSSIGVVFAFVSNDKVNDAIKNFDNTVNAALNSSLNFIDDTQRVRNLKSYIYKVHS